jgi:hypothetical protein
MCIVNTTISVCALSTPPFHPKTLRLSLVQPREEKGRGDISIKFMFGSKEEREAKVF